MEEPDSGSETSPKSDAISWTASEFVAHDKSFGWYFMLGLATVFIAIIVHFITKDLVSVAVVIVAAILLAVYGSHSPRQLEYKLDRKGFGIGSKNYKYDQFRSFSVVTEGAFSSIVFMPLKRFAVPISIYYAPDDEEKILGLLSGELPFEQAHKDAVDSLMRKIRF